MGSIDRNDTGQLVEAARIERRPPANLIEGDAELFSEAYSYETFNSYLKSITKAWVSSDSVVYRYGIPVREILYWPDQISYYRWRYLAKKLITARKVKLPNRQYLLVTDQESWGHYHWLTEVVPKLWSVREKSQDFVLLLPDVPYLRTIGLQTLEALALEFDDIVWMKESEVYSAPDLSYVTRIAASGQLHDPIMRQLNQAFAGEPGVASRRLYISRNNAGFRHVINEPELVDLLMTYGFDILSPEDRSFASQVSAFSECKTLVSIHGAGLTNCLLMPPGGNVVELRKREKNFAYWHLAEAVGHTYYYYHGRPDSELSLIGRGCNLTIDLRDFENRVLSTIANKK